MAKLYFRYGCMGSSKTANALMTRFNYLEMGYQVLLLKPAIDSRWTKDEVVSRIGLSARAILFSKEDSIKKIAEDFGKVDCIVMDECQFATSEQVDELREIVDDLDIPAFCYGLRTDFMTKMFPGSMRLFELSDSITEMKSICECGQKAIVNARFDGGKVVYEGEQVVLGGNDRYKAMCYKCWNEQRLNSRKNKE